MDLPPVLHHQLLEQCQHPTSLQISSGLTPDPYMATEPLEVAMVSLDDFLSSNPNFNFLDRILGYDSPENNISTVPTASQEKDHPADSSGKNDYQGKENKRESKRK